MHHDVDQLWQCGTNNPPTYIFSVCLHHCAMWWWSAAGIWQEWSVLNEWGKRLWRIYRINNTIYITLSSNWHRYSQLSKFISRLWITIESRIQKTISRFLDLISDIEAYISTTCQYVGYFDLNHLAGKLYRDFFGEFQPDQSHTNLSSVITRAHQQVWQCKTLLLILHTTFLPLRRVAFHLITARGKISFRKLHIDIKSISPQQS